MMYWKPYVMARMKKNGGIIRAKELKELGFPRRCLTELLEQGAIRRISRGIYLRIDYEEDEMLVIQKKYPQMIFSHDTALCLSKVIWCHYNNLTVSVPSGYKVSPEVDLLCNVFYIKRSLYEIGRTTRGTVNGAMVNTYDVERSICDLVRSRRSYPSRYVERRLLELFGVEDATKRCLIPRTVEKFEEGVARYRQIDYKRLWSYASMFGVESFLDRWFEEHDIDRIERDCMV